MPLSATHPYICYDRAFQTIIFSLYLLPSQTATSSLPYLLHALPSPLPHRMSMYQCLLMCPYCAPFMSTSPRCYLMYYRAFCTQYQSS